MAQVDRGELRVDVAERVPPADSAALHAWGPPASRIRDAGGQLAGR